jgi:hypothetical protein
MKKETDMAIHGSQGILNVIRQPKPSNPYAVPRYRVTLVRDGRATAPSSPLLTSVGAADVLRPLFAHLDREPQPGHIGRHSLDGTEDIGALVPSLTEHREVLGFPFLRPRVNQLLEKGFPSVKVGEGQHGADGLPQPLTHLIHRLLDLLDDQPAACKSFG